MAWGSSGSVDDEAYFAFPTEVVWVLLQNAIRSHPSLEVKDVQHASMRIDFVSGWSAWTTGQRMSAAVFPQGAGALVRVGGAAKMSSQIGTASRLKKLNSDVIAAVGAEIQKMPTEVKSPPENEDGLGIADQIERLTSLLTAGVLSQEEFEAGKRKILGL